MSPSSAGRLRSLFPERSSVCRNFRLAMSGGILWRGRERHDKIKSVQLKRGSQNTCGGVRVGVSVHCMYSRSRELTPVKL